MSEDILFEIIFLNVYIFILPKLIFLSCIYIIKYWYRVMKAGFCFCRPQAVPQQLNFPGWKIRVGIEWFLNTRLKFRSIVESDQ